MRDALCRSPCVALSTGGRADTGAGASVDEMAWMRQLLDWQKEAGDAGEFLDNLRYEMAHSEIFVFTPKGDIHTLPAGSTPVWMPESSITGRRFCTSRTSLVTCRPSRM